eukprot:1443-Heterococcus_DN1.PRE.10
MSCRLQCAVWCSCLPKRCLLLVFPLSTAFLQQRSHTIIHCSREFERTRVLYITSANDLQQRQYPVEFIATLWPALSHYSHYNVCIERRLQHVNAEPAHYSGHHECADAGCRCAIHAGTDSLYSQGVVIDLTACIRSNAALRADWRSVAIAALQNKLAARDPFPSFTRTYLFALTAALDSGADGLTTSAHTHEDNVVKKNAKGVSRLLWRAKVQHSFFPY